jgi:hypothetical protein
MLYVLLMLQCSAAAMYYYNSYEKEVMMEVLETTRRGKLIFTTVTILISE